MEILVFAKGGAASGKTHMLIQMRKLLEAKGFTVKFPGLKPGKDHEHTFQANRSDDWVKENVGKK